TSAGEDVCDASKVGGEATFAVFSETRGLDPVVSSGGGTTGASELMTLYDTLVRYDAESATFQPWVAESLEPNEDATEWTLKLRPNVRFGSGNPLTTDAVKASIARHGDPANRAVSAADVQQIEEMRIIDDLTMVFVLK